MPRAVHSRTADPRQGDFLALLEGAIDLPFPAPPQAVAGALDFDQDTRRLLNATIAAAPFGNRHDFAEALSFHAGRRISKAMLDAYTGARRPHALPAHLVPAICRTAGNTTLLNGLAEAAGCTLTESAALVRARVERLSLFIRLARAEQRRLEHG